MRTDKENNAFFVFSVSFVHFEIYGTLFIVHFIANFMRLRRRSSNGPNPVQHYAESHPDYMIMPAYSYSVPVKDFDIIITSYFQTQAPLPGVSIASIFDHFM